jgi:hypothetical protein
MQKQGTIELRLTHDATQYTAKTVLVYRATGIDAKVTDAFVNVNDVQHAIRADADLLELTHSYQHKWVNRATLNLGDSVFEDTDGDGRLELRDGSIISDRIRTWELVAEHDGCPEADFFAKRWKPMHDILSELSGSRAMERSFRASCGSTAAVVHELPSHSVLWASIPPQGSPNEVHRHLGGNVYCLFVKGTGRFHRLHPHNGFETIAIEVSELNPIHFIPIPTHMWYQPINTGSSELQYFMIHEPGFDSSELLRLQPDECRNDWGFEYE